MFSSWYQGLSFSESLFCPAFIVGTFPVQPSLLYTAFIFGNFCADFIAAPNLFSAILQSSLCQFFFLTSSPVFSLLYQIFQPSFNLHSYFQALRFLGIPFFILHCCTGFLREFSGKFFGQPSLLYQIFSGYFMPAFSLPFPAFIAGVILNLHCGFFFCGPYYLYFLTVYCCFMSIDRVRLHLFNY